MRIKYTVIKPDFLRHIQPVKETGCITGLTMLLDNVIMICFDFLYVFPVLSSIHHDRNFIKTTLYGYNLFVGGWNS